MKYLDRKPKFFEPEFIADSVDDIDFKILKSMGIKAVLIDLDGTVVERGKYEVKSSIKKALKSQPLKIYIATNRPKSRDLKDLKLKLSAEGVIHPKGLLGKPFTNYYKEALKIAGLKANEVIMIGDRYIQDIIGANLAGLHTLVVSKLDDPTNRFDKLLSATERRWTEIICKKYKQVK